MDSAAVTDQEAEVTTGAKGEAEEATRVETQDMGTTILGEDHH